jgi:acyl-coenzyme A synthetase/AMP-(fatty) acid ligase
LLIGGASLALGYLGDPAATADKFVTRSIAGKLRRFFRTGDRVKLQCDGNFKYLDRLDRQLKIGGYRVAPEKIERALRTHHRIVDAAVSPDHFNGELSLAAWIVREDASLTALALRE